MARKILICSICQKGCSGPQGLRLHLRGKHKITDITKDELYGYIEKERDATPEEEEQRDVKKEKINVGRNATSSLKDEFQELKDEVAKSTKSSYQEGLNEREKRRKAFLDKYRTKLE